MDKCKDINNNKHNVDRDGKVQETLATASTVHSPRAQTDPTESPRVFLLISFNVHFHIYNN